MNSKTVQLWATATTTVTSLCTLHIHTRARARSLENYQYYQQLFDIKWLRVAYSLPPHLHFEVHTRGRRPAHILTGCWRGVDEQHKHLHTHCLLSDRSTRTHVHTTVVVIIVTRRGLFINNNNFIIVRVWSFSFPPSIRIDSIVVAFQRHGPARQSDFLGHRGPIRDNRRHTL